MPSTVKSTLSPNEGVGKTHHLGRITKSALLACARDGALAVLPVGSVEQHGQHLPVATDGLLAQAVCDAAAVRAHRTVLVAPPIWYGFSPHHERFGATISVQGETLVMLVREIVASLRRWVPEVVIVNGHGGNRGPLSLLALGEGCRVVSYWELLPASIMADLFPTDLGSIGHAGEAETSMVLSIASELVGAAGPDFEPIQRASEAFAAPDMGASGVLGNPAAADPDRGTRFLEAAAASLAAYLDEPAPSMKGA
jgi:creatinine amidohydrolase